jgi:hypothetical protein
VLPTLGLEIGFSLNTEKNQDEKDTDRLSGPVDVYG